MSEQKGIVCKKCFDGLHAYCYRDSGAHKCYCPCRFGEPTCCFKHGNEIGHDDGGLCVGKFDAFAAAKRRAQK